MADVEIKIAPTLTEEAQKALREQLKGVVTGSFSEGFKEAYIKQRDAGLQGTKIPTISKNLKETFPELLASMSPIGTPEHKLEYAEVSKLLRYWENIARNHYWQGSQQSMDMLSWIVGEESRLKRTAEISTGVFRQREHFERFKRLEAGYTRFNRQWGGVDLSGLSSDEIEGLRQEFFPLARAYREVAGKLGRRDIQQEIDKNRRKVGYQFTKALKGVRSEERLEAKKQEYTEQFRVAESEYNTYTQHLLKNYKKMSYDEQVGARAGLRYYTNELVKSARKSGKYDKELAKNVADIAHRIKSFDKKIGGGLKDGGFVKKHLLGPIALGAGGITFGTYYSDFVKGFYSNRTDPYTQAVQRLQHLKKYSAGLVGALIGGTLGSVIPGAGTAAGASVGALVGGAAGTILGGSSERRQAALESSFADVIDAEKWRALYGNNRVGNWHFAKQAQAAGFVTAGDMSSLQSKQNIFMPSAAFGEISDDQWLALSMMPHYFATMISGADQAAQLKALQKDYSALGPGFGEFFSRKLGISENIRAWAASGRLGGLENDIRIAKAMEAELYGRESGIYSKRHMQQMKDVVGREYAWDKAESNWSMFTGAPGFFKEILNTVSKDKEAFTKRDLTIVIDGVSVNTNIPIYTDDRELSSDKQIQNAVGSSL